MRLRPISIFCFSFFVFKSLICKGYYNLGSYGILILLILEPSNLKEYADHSFKSDEIGGSS